MALFVGLLLWLFLMVRVFLPALRKPGEQKQLVTLLAVARAAIALFYGAGLTWGQHTHLLMVEYWRWWVVHLWVEGFFEVFATTVITFFFMRLGLVRPGVAAAAALLSATIFLSGGIIGTCHYYMQGLNTTPLHGHAALFGVYGMLGIGLMLVCLRALIPGKEWREGTLKFSFWAMNGGLMAMCVLSLLPVGLLQTWASVEHDYWYAQSSEFMQTPLMQNLRWMRVPGDTIFFFGAMALVVFVAGLKTGHSFKKAG